MFVTYCMCVQRSSVATEERDVYEELLTQQEIQSSVDLVNSKCGTLIYTLGKWAETT